MSKTTHYLACAVLMLMLLGGCSVNKYIPEGQYLLDGVNVESDNKEVKTSNINLYLRQKPNAKWFSLFRIPMYIYSASGKDSTRWMNRALKRLGDAPEIYDEQLAEESRRQIERYVRNMGYMGAQVEMKENADKNRMKVKYSVKTGRPYKVNSLAYDIYDDKIREMVMTDTLHSLLRAGMRFDVNVLEQERQRITSQLQNRGYYRFNKDYISYTADTVRNTYLVDLTLKVMPMNFNQDKSYTPHTCYKIRDVNYLMDVDIVSLSENTYRSMDSVRRDSVNFFYTRKPFLRPGVLLSNTHLQRGGVFSIADVQNTYSSLARLNILKFTNIRFRENNAAPGDTATLDAYITLTKNKNKSISFEIEGTNSAGDLGAAAAVEYNHRNIFHGSETFSLRLRGAYEAVRGLEGYTNTDYMEYGVEAGLSFPGFMIPFLSADQKRKRNANSELSVKYNWQIRPEFERTLAAATWSYRWNRQRTRGWHKVDVLDLNYIYMPYRSGKFNEYLNEMDEINPLLRYSYEDLFIVRMGYTYTYNSIGATPMQTVHKSSYSVRVNVEEAGNLLYGLAKSIKRHTGANGSYQLANIDFAQYVKFDFDYARNWVIDDRNALVFHTALGVAYPYGNSKSLPFEKLYFSGGANSVRGWSVRSLGPGGYKGIENRLDYVNHTGDIKLDLNLEYRTDLFWKLKGAFYIDAGNIWNINRREGQPEGFFRFDRFYKQMAVSYGLGIRFDLDFLVLRFDSGMKAVNPMHKGAEQFPIINPDFKRDFAFHFAVGYPF